MDRIRGFAELSVRRGCSFAALAIATTMFGLSSTPLLAIECGAILCTLTAVVLFYKSLRAPMRDYRRTELWILLDRRHDLPEAYAGRVLNTVLRDVYLRYAELGALAALALWLLVFAGWLLF